MCYKWLDSEFLSEEENHHNEHHHPPYLYDLGLQLSLGLDPT